ncbi:MAG: T9SS type A sorting domain-containing protein [Flavobacteriaceae bacterium]|nr:T9SS type A sorting domain-containing protein [Flavobacteriaceae bacterium]
MSITSSLGVFSVAGLTTDATVSIYSMNGKRILSVDDYAGKSINISALSSGLYLVSIESEDW